MQRAVRQLPSLSAPLGSLYSSSALTDTPQPSDGYPSRC